MMSCCLYKECHPPTGVTLCEAAYFTHAPAARTATSRPSLAPGRPAGTPSPSPDGAPALLPNLVVVRTNHLEVYSIRSAAGVAAAPAAAGSSGSSATPAAATTSAAAAAATAAMSGGARLELVGSYHLHGVVESLAVLSGATPRRRDALLLAFRDAKLSVVEWDPRVASLRTSSMHYFEGDVAVQRETGRAALPTTPRVVTDPAGRCAAMCVYFCHLALMPALEADPLELGGGGGSSGGGGGGAASLGNGYLLNLHKMMGIREVRDCCFLHGYTEPVLLLLHEPDPTWVGRLRERKDTCCLTAISISLRLKRHTLLWKAAGLPYDSFKLLAVPYRPAVLVISPNLIILASQASQQAAALNSNALPGEAPPPLVFDPGREHPAATAARLAAEFALNVHPDCAPAAGRNATLIADLEAVAAGAAAAWLTPSTCLMGLQSGALLAVHLQFDGPPDQRITAVRTGGGPVATALVGVTMAAVSRAPATAAGTAAAAAPAALAAAQSYMSYRGPKGLMFLGSWTGDSVLMQLRPRKAAAGPSAADGAEGGDGVAAGGGRTKRGRGQGDGDGGDGDGGGDAVTNRSAAVAAAAAAFAAAAAAADASGLSPRYNLRLLDSLPSVGPVGDLLFADTSVSSYTSGTGGAEGSSRGGPTCFLCVGQGQTGAIVMARQGLLPDVLTEVSLPGIAGVFAVHHRTEDEDIAAMAFDDVTTAADDAGGGGGGGGGGGADGTGDGDGDDDADDVAGRRTTVVEMSPEPPDVEEEAAGGGGGADGGGGGGGEGVGVKGEADGADGGGGGGGGGGGEVVGGLAVKAESGSGSPAPKMGAGAAAEAADANKLDAAVPDGAVVAVKASPPPASKTSSPGPRDAAAGGAAGGAPQRPAGPPYHAYLLISVGRTRSMVLRCAEGLDDVTTSPGCDFLTDQPTLATGNLFHSAAIIQACPMGLRVLEGMSLIQDLPVSELQALGHVAPTSRAAGAAPPTITGMQACDPYVLVSLSNGTALLLEGDPLSMTLGLATSCPAAFEHLLAAPARSRTMTLAAACLQRDETGWMAANTPPPLPEPLGAATMAHDADGGGGMDADGGLEGATAAAGGGGGVGGDVYLWICRRTGRLECYALPSMRLVFQSPGLAGAEEVLRMGPAVMYGMADLFGGGGEGDDGVGEGPGGGGGGGGGVWMEDPVVELRVEAFQGASQTSPRTAPPDCERPVLLALTASGTLLAYQAFNPSGGPGGPGPRVLGPGAPQGDLGDTMVAIATHGSAAAAAAHQLAFRRLALDTLSHEAPAPVAAAGPAGAGTCAAVGPRMVRFDHVAAPDPMQRTHGTSYSGIFLSGARPLWLVASRGGLVPHPMFVEGPVASITPFHNVNCPMGFITACSARGQLKVCQLQPHTRLDGPWVTRRVPLRVTPHRLAWFRDAGLLAAITSRHVPSRPRPPEEPGGDPHAAAAYAAAAAAAAGRRREEAWEVRLLEPAGCSRLWSSALLPPGEQALCLRVVYLQNTTSGDTDALLAVGTGCPMGEDYPCLGRILLYQVAAEVVDLGAGNLTRRWSATLVASRDMASAVTSVQEFKSQLLVTCGSRVEMYGWRGAAAAAAASAAGGGGGGGGSGGGLEKRAFFDLPSLATSLVAVKDYLLAADATQGLYFVRYSDAARVLEFMSKDFDHRDVVAAGVVINEPKLAFIAADAAGSLGLSEFYGTRNTNPEFWAGQRLAPLGQLHVARRLTGATSLKMATADGRNRHALLCGAAEGGLVYIAPVWDPQAAQRLALLQAHLSRHTPHVAGLNPRSFRHRFCRIPKALGGGESHHAPPPPLPRGAQGAGAGGGAGGGGWLDGQLLLDVFPHLPAAQQQAAAEAVGTTAGQLMADIRAIVAAATLC